MYILSMGIKDFTDRIKKIADRWVTRQLLNNLEESISRLENTEGKDITETIDIEVDVKEVDAWLKEKEQQEDQELIGKEDIEKILPADEQSDNRNSNEGMFND